jgi:hypothetical protein
MLHPARKLDSLIDGLGRFVELVCPVQGQTGAVFGGHVQTNPIQVRTLGLPKIYAKVAFGLKGIVEHTLARRDFAIVNVVRFAIGNEADVEIFLTQADSKLQASLTAADNCNPHFSPLRDETPGRGHGRDEFLQSNQDKPPPRLTTGPGCPGQSWSVSVGIWRW